MAKKKQKTNHKYSSSTVTATKIPTPRKKKDKSNHKTKGKNTPSSSSNDWISALAAKASSTKDLNDKSQPVLTKNERIQRRDAKKRRREERRGDVNKDAEDDAQRGKRLEGSLTMQGQDQKQMTFYRAKLSKTIEVVLDDLKQTADESSRPLWKRNQKYIPDEKKGKATTGQQLSETKIQPRTRDYGGLGLARPSLLLLLRDPSFIPKFELEFAEHVEGFFGKQRTKAMKKQLDGNLLWRQMQRLKEGSENASRNSGGKNKGTNLNVRYHGKKLMEMTPDERVEAMIQLNML